MLDLIVRGGTLVQATGLVKADLLIDEGCIVGLSEEATESAKNELDATGLHVFPGLIDTHVHFNEPGRGNWEGLLSGSSALAAGGGTSFFDMPLNSDPPLLRSQDFKAKQAAAEALSLTDFAFWGGLTPDNLDHLEDLADLGVVGFKAFMSNSGIAEFKAVDDLSLYRGMLKAAELGLPVALHAESEALTRQLTQEARALAQRDAQSYLDSRPIIAELEAISRALLFAKETNCDLHIVHVTNAKGMTLIAEAKRGGQRVSSETCAHYLQFTDQDVLRLGAIAKCAPPLRNETERQALWQAVVQDDVDMIASDHSPSDPELKERSDFFEVWGGISGVQSTLNVLLHHCDQQGLALEQVSQLIAANPAKRFALANKGKLEPSFDADLSLVDLNESFSLRKDDLFYQHKLSPYVGEQFKARVKQTLVRGQTIFKEGTINTQSKGKLLKPLRTA